MKEYKVICRLTPEGLEPVLNSMAANGWQLVSGFSTQILPGEREFQCVAIMEREKNNSCRLK